MTILQDPLDHQPHQDGSNFLLLVSTKRNLKQLNIFTHHTSLLELDQK